MGNFRCSLAVFSLYDAIFSCHEVGKFARKRCFLASFLLVMSARARYHKSRQIIALGIVLPSRRTALSVTSSSRARWGAYAVPQFCPHSASRRLAEIHAREYSGIILAPMKLWLWKVIQAVSAWSVVWLSVREQGGPAKHDICRFWRPRGVEHTHSVQEVVLVALPFTTSTPLAKSSSSGSMRCQQAGVGATGRGLWKERGGHRFCTTRRLMRSAVMISMRCALRHMERRAWPGLSRVKCELGGEAHGAHHAQGSSLNVMSGVERCAYGAFAYIFGVPVGEVPDEFAGKAEFTLTAMALMVKSRRAMSF